MAIISDINPIIVVAYLFLATLLSGYGDILQVRTPLLMMVGEVDQRVPPKQNHEYRKALQARGVKVK